MTDFKVPSLSDLYTKNKIEIQESENKSVIDKTFELAEKTSNEIKETNEASESIAKSYIPHHVNKATGKVQVAPVKATGPYYNKPSPKYTCPHCGAEKLFDNSICNQCGYGKIPVVTKPLLHDIVSQSIQNPSPNYPHSKQIITDPIENEYFSTYSQDLQEFINYWSTNFISEVAEFYTAQLIKKFYQDVLAGQETLSGDDAAYSSLISDNATSFLNYPNSVLTQMNKIINRQTKNITEFFRIYEWMTCFGEARHARGRAHNGYAAVKIPPWIGKGKGRQACWQDAWRMYHELTEDALLKKALQIVLVFDHMQWSSSFGGKKWGTIIKTFVRNVCGEIPNETYVDMSVSLVHNNNIFVDKIGVNTIELKKLLDHKFNAKSTTDTYRVYKYITNPTYPFAEAINWIENR
jgi:hypothetical protein